MTVLYLMVTLLCVLVLLSFMIVSSQIDDLKKLVETRPFQVTVNALDTRASGEFAARLKAAAKSVCEHEYQSNEKFCRKCGQELVQR